MNLVQRIVAENRKFVTSQELAEAFGMSHEECCQFLKNYRNVIERHGVLDSLGQGFLLNIPQCFKAILVVEMSEQFYAGTGKTPADFLKTDMQAFSVKLINILRQAETHIASTKRHVLLEVFRPQIKERSNP